MTTPEKTYRPGHEREDLLALLQKCARRAGEKKCPQLLSITLRVRHIDPLAVLQAVQRADDRHAFFELPSEDAAIAGIDTAMQMTVSGKKRFKQLRAFAGKISANAVIAGDVDAPFAGPHFFCEIEFEDDSPAKIFVPRWQVARHEGNYTAVANVAVDENTPLESAADRILAAHRRYQHFEYKNDAGEPDAGNATPPALTEIGGDRYADAVRRALEKIRAGECGKIVLARTFRAESLSPISVPRALELLRARFPACCTFSFSDGSTGTFIGATPEKLAAVSGNKLHTEALAGTAPRGIRASDDARLGAGLIESEKDRREHETVTEEIIARLKKAGIDAKADGAPRLLELPNVRHLRTPISGTLPPEAHLLDIAEILHPTPAVGGTPREAALKAIAEIEPQKRGPYAGLVGWFDAAGNGRLSVGLRSALVSGNTATLFAGAGIVAGSVPEEECRETTAKLSAMRDALR